MKTLLVSIIALASFSQSMACMSGSEYYSVIIPRSLNLMKGPENVVVGDVLVLSDALKITNGNDILKEIGFNDVAGYNAGKYYLVKSKGTFEVTQTYESSEAKMTYNATVPPRMRGGCADFRQPASTTTPEAKAKK